MESGSPRQSTSTRTTSAGLRTAGASPRAVAKSPYTRLTSSNGPVDRLAPRVVRSRGADRLTVTSLCPRSHRRLAMQVVRPIGGSGGLTQPAACHRCRSDPGKLTLQWPWVEGGQDGLVPGGERGALGDLAVAGGEGDQVHPVE